MSSRGSGGRPSKSSQEEKYQTKNISDLKIGSKKLLQNLIDFAEKDSNNVKLFENLLLSVNFKKIDEEVLEKFVKKSKDKWLKKNSIWKKKMKSLEGEDDKSGSESDFDSGSDSDKEDESGSESGSGSDSGSSSGIPYFDKKLHGTNLVIDKKNKRKIKFNGSGWTGSALGNKKNCAKWAIKLTNGQNNYLMLGMGPKTINLQGNNYSKCGYYIYLPSGHKYSQKGDSHAVYKQGSIAQGTIYSIYFNKKKEK